MGRLVQDEALIAAARATLEAYAGELNAQPESHPYSLMAANLLMEPMQEVVIAGKSSDPATQALLAPLHKRFLPSAVIALADGGEIESLAPFTKSQVPVNGKPAAYACRDYACQAPVTDVASLERLL